MTKQSKATSIFFILAGCLLLAYVAWNISEWLINCISVGDFYLYSISWLISMSTTTALGILMILRKNNIATTIVIGIITVMNFYWLYDEIQWYLDSEYDPSAIWIIVYLIDCACFTLLTLISAMCLGGKNSGIKNIWFLPAVLYLVSDCMWRGNNLLDGYGISIRDIFYILETEVYIAAIALAGLAISRPKAVEGGQQPEGYIPVPQPVQAPVQQPVAPRPQPVQQPVYTQPQPVRPVDQPVNNNVDEYETIRKYKALLDEGIITEEEFQEKKKKLLDV